MQVSSDLPSGKKDTNKYKNIDDFAKERKIGSNFTTKIHKWNVIKEYNEKHKTNKSLTGTPESFKVADAYVRFLKDVTMRFFDIKLPFEKLCTNKDGFFSAICGQTSWFTYKEFNTIDP